jgi:hypothetical protein
VPLSELRHQIFFINVRQGIGEPVSRRFQFLASERVG